MPRNHIRFLHTDEDSYEISEDVEGVRDTVLMHSCHYVADGEDLVTTMQRAVPRRRDFSAEY